MTGSFRAPRRSLGKKQANFMEESSEERVMVQRGCHVKKYHHKSEMDANTQIHSLIASPKFRPSEYPLKAYECPCGKGWCIGHDRRSKTTDQIEARP